ncbi:MAG: sulfatase-like hydrolase/transferase, partial [Novosphingobium sp.]|nr:sulfatase-like hydrolase/transferase [Novosphingobium sp.]
MIFAQGRTRKLRAALLGCVVSSSLIASSVVLAAAPADQNLPLPPPGATLETAGPAHWPEPAKAPAGAPNVLIIMTDDVGFGSSSTFGGPVPTPAFDALAREGLRYNRFHTTAICSPTRASLLTGRNPQDVGVGYVTNWSSGFDGYNSMIPKSAGTLPQVLRANGYDTAMFGKSHVTPEWEQGPNGPFDRWPTGLGFGYFYGFLGADTSAFEPSLIENTRPSITRRGSDYHLDRDLADRTIAWIAEQRATTPERPFFVYLAPGTAHAPNHAPADWLERFRGRFDMGWDKLREDIVRRQKRLGVIPRNAQDAPRPETLPRWADLPPERQRLYARYMEAYAASLAYADYQIGRVIASLRESGEIDNTLIVYIQGDNGASAEGSFDGKLFEQSALAGVKEDPAYAEDHIDDIGTERAYNLNTGGWGWAMNA